MNDSQTEEILNSGSGRFHDTEALGTDRGYQRLEHLYEISKCLADFESLEKTFPEILNLVSDTFPIRSAVLVEKRGGTANTVIWQVSGLSDAGIDRTIAKAKATFNYLSNSTPLDASTLQLASTAKFLFGEHQVANQFETGVENNLLIFPLVMERDSIFGVLQFEGLQQLNEQDIRFANALSNLIAIAFDRHHRAKEDRERLRKAAEIVRTERDDSRKFVTELEEERALREKFVQTLSHDLRNPLSTASMAAQILERSKALAPDDLKVVKRLLSSTKRLDQMINYLLDANRLKAGEKLPLEIEECDFGSVLVEIINELNEYADGRIKYDCSEKVSGYWDCNGLTRMVENLVGNAKKYSEPGTPIRVSLRNTKDGALLSVYNEGNPISSEEQKTLFKQFRRTESAKSDRKAGWGLGLTLVRGICDAHGGKVWVESGKSTGTTFYAQFPYDSRPFQGAMT